MLRAIKFSYVTCLSKHCRTTNDMRTRFHRKGVLIPDQLFVFHTKNWHYQEQESITSECHTLLCTCENISQLITTSTLWCSSTCCCYLCGERERESMMMFAGVVGGGVKPLLRCSSVRCSVA